MSEQDRLVSTFTPPTPCWAVYADVDENTPLATDQIVAFAVWEITVKSRGEVDRYSDVRPLVLTGEGVTEEGGEDVTRNFLGLSFTATPKLDEWQAELDSYRARFPRSASKS